MKKILLLGDSIRMGYDSFVKEELDGEYEVYYDDLDNGRFTAYTIWMFNQLNSKYGPFDYVHFNNGYWDMNREGPNGERQTPVYEYINDFKRLISLIKETGATPIFGTIIPLKDDYLPEEGRTYSNKDVIEYNEAALKLMKEENVLVDDLYSIALKGDKYYKCPDTLHLVEEGYIALAKQIANFIRNIDK